MSSLTVNAAGPAANGHRAQILAEAVVSAYIHELAPPRRVRGGAPRARVRPARERDGAPTSIANARSRRLSRDDRARGRNVSPGSRRRILVGLQSTDENRSLVRSNAV